MKDPSPPPELLRQAASSNAFVVLLANHGNPDHGQNPYQPIWGAPMPQWVCVASLEEASAACRAYIAKHDLGSGNWREAKVLNGQGEHVASISYNARIWSKRSTAQQTDASSAALPPQRPRGG